MGSMGLDHHQDNNNFRAACDLQKFRLYETRSNFYMIGRDKSRTCWKILKINRLLEQSELSLTEDPTLYSEIECSDLLKRLHDGNKSTGGLKFVTTCYGIVGFIKFLGPSYMILITQRRKIGTICGHAVYSIAKSDMILIHSNVKSNMPYSKNENRYKKLLRSMDLTKDFYFSYSYRVMLSLQKNLSNHQTGMKLYETMFVWNEFLTRGIRNQLKNTAWIVALVYGFFKQVTLSISGREFNLILLARRSRHYAGTRYLKRGVNDIGRVANDVETEQIVLEDVPEGCPVQISSVVQVRGSIPLFWSQESSRLNIKPDIILSNKDKTYEATKLHFQNLVKRYGNPIIILNLIKTREKKPRESILRVEFANAIEVINKNLARERRLKFLHWDLSRYSRNKSGSVLAYLVKVAANALNLTGFFYCGLQPSSSELPYNSSCNDQFADKDLYNPTILADLNVKDNIDDKDLVEGSNFSKPMLLQKGVLRTNCIDCLDRTNVAQYTYGLVALGHQLHALGYVGVSSISLDSPLADDLMKAYEAMGDTLSLQYGGSTAHNKIFSETRGQWKAATHSQELLRNFQRYCSNAYMDAEKQAAINMFLGHFQPQQGRPALWELDSDQHYSGARGSDFSEENERPVIKRSLSDGNIPCGSSNSNIDDDDSRAIQQMDSIHKPLPAKIPDRSVELLEATSQVSTFDTSLSYSRHTPSVSCSQLLSNMQPEQYLSKDSISLAERGDSFNCSNFLVSDWLSSSGNSCEEDTYERSLLIPSPDAGLSSNEMRQQCSAAFVSGSSLKGKEVANVNLGCEAAASSSNNLSEFSKQFVNWVTRENGLWL